MAHGPDTEEIQDLFENMQDGYLDIDLNKYDITSLPEFPQGVVNLFISRGNLPQIPNFPPGLRVIRIQDVGTENGIPPLPEGLLEFGCIETNLTTLPALPSTLTKLTCYANAELSFIPALPPTLIEIDCSENNLTSLPALPPTLRILACDGNTLQSLPALPPTLTKLHCATTGLTTLPALPPALKELYCLGNQLTTLPDLPATLTHLHCPNNRLTTLPALPPTLTYLGCGNNPIITLPALPAGLQTLNALHCNQLETLTPPCPEALKLTNVRELFIGSLQLEPSPKKTELLGEYMDRIAGVAPRPRPKWAGYSKADVELFTSFFNPETRNNISVCPVCLGYADRIDGCMYMTHVCDPEARHDELYKMYADDYDKIEWCTICGRITGHHRHFTLNLPDEKRPAYVSFQATDLIEHYKNDCRGVGGGGSEEKFRRLEKLLNYACQLQEEVGKGDAKEVRKELIEEVWKSALLKDRTVLKKFEKGKFDFPCEFPEDAAPNQPERVYPDIPVPAGVVPPVRHETPDNQCITELDEHDDHRPVYQFIHENWNHQGQYICGPDLENLLKTNMFSGLCPISPGECKSRLYPVELTNLVSPQYLEDYRKLFNKQFAVQAGGGTSIMYKIDPKTIQCPVMPKAGRRKTYRRKRRLTKKRALRSSFKKHVRVKK